MKTIGNGSNLDEIIFENRNKAYGAYSLRKNYKKHVIFALCCTLGFLMMSMSTPFIIGYISPEVIVIANGDETHVIDVMKPPVDEPAERIDLPKPPPPSNLIQNQLNFAPEVVDNPDEKPIEVTDPELVTGDSANFSSDDNINYTPIDEPEEIIEPEIIDEAPLKPFEADEPPEFVGGEIELQKFIRDHARYPEEAKGMNIEGKVYVEFVVAKTGEITNIQLARSADPMLDRVALKAIHLMPKWNPGKKSGNPVSVRLTIPIAFLLIK